MFQSAEFHILVFVAPIILLLVMVIVTLIYIEKNRLQYLRIIKILSGWQSALLLLVIIPVVLVAIDGSSDSAYNAIGPWLLYFLFYRLRARRGYYGSSTKDFDEELEALSEKDSKKIDAYKRKNLKSHKITLAVIVSTFAIGILWRFFS